MSTSNYSIEDRKHYEADALLRDGTPIRLRAVRPQDKDLLNDLFHRLSARSVYYRFFQTTTRLTEEQLRSFTELDFSKHAGLVATRAIAGKETVIGVGRYSVIPDTSPVQADVAFAVEDKYQGLGIGTLLLEHLRPLAEASGITEFVAHVLGENNRMLQVFASSGFDIHRSVEEGIVTVRFGLRPDERFSAESFLREKGAAAESIKTFLQPRSVAVVGASRDPESIGGLILRNIIQCGFKYPIYPINPKATEIQGLQAYPSLSAVPEDIDLMIVAVPAVAVESVMNEAVEKGISGAVVISAGFGEVSHNDRSAEERLCQIARSAGMRLIGPNCMGILTTDPDFSLNATFSPIWPQAGSISILSQSGALGMMILDCADKFQIGVRSFISVGNKADVSGNDLMCYWADDPGTKVIALYLESFGNPGRFARLAPRIARDKPIVAVKSGRSAAGIKAAASHTAALASRDLAVETLFEQAGVIRTDTLEELFDVISLLSSQPTPRGPRVGVVTNAGGPGILLADALDSRGLKLPEPSDDVKRRLREFLPAEASLTNPIDMIASASPEDYRKTIEIVGNDPGIDSLIVIYIPPLVSDPVEVAQAIAAAAATVPKDIPLLNVFLSSKEAPKELHQGGRGNMPCFTFPENAATALSRAEWYGRWRNKPQGQPLEVNDFTRSSIRAVIDRVKSEHGEECWLSQGDIETILRALQIDLAVSEIVAPEDAGATAERLGYPLVAKIVSNDVLHKSDSGCVITNLQSKQDVLDAVKTISDKASALGANLDGIMLQRYIKGEVEMLVGVSSDPLFGPLIATGLGGVNIEIFSDAAFRLPPVTDLDAENMISRLKAAKLLSGYRGSAPADREALKDVLMKISCLVQIVPELLELDLNPVKVLEPGHGAVVVDARMRIRTNALSEHAES